jgi:hypothetical protein
MIARRLAMRADTYRADTYKVTHWMNVRKVTARQVAEAVGQPLDPMTAGAWPSALVAAVARFLQVQPHQLAASERGVLTVLIRTAAELRETARPIRRGGIHFYNYYSMASPPDAVGPVILDILCPADRLPDLNNGHLEPAITVNIGPGDIHGRWGDVLTESTWQVLQANGDDDNWIAGDSYIEPSYCPHSYSLASELPARIISYTAQSNLAGLVETMNDWADAAVDRLLSLAASGLGPRDVAELLLSRRGHSLATAAAALRVTPEQLATALDQGALDVLRDLGLAVGLDYRLLLASVRRHDEVGKTCRTVAECRADAREFRGYLVASLVGAPHLPDLTGMFMRVDGPGAELCEPGETHYLVTGGAIELDWTQPDGSSARVSLEADGTAWVAPFVAHRWSGSGSVIKLGSGQHLGYLDLAELTNTYTAAATLRRGRHDGRFWGYDS